MVTLTFVRHASSSSKKQRCERALFYLNNSRRVKALFIILVKPVNLLWGEILVSVLRLHTLTSKNAKAPCMDIQPRVRGLVGTPCQHFPRNFLENQLDLNVSTHRLQNFSLEISNLIVPLYNISSRHTNQSMVSIKQFPTDAHL